MSMRILSIIGQIVLTFAAAAGFLWLMVASATLGRIVGGSVRIVEACQ